MLHRERGVTFLGWIVILVPMALVLYAAIRLAPLYLEDLKIKRTLQQVSEEFKGDAIDPSSLRVAIERRFDIESVTVINKNDVKITKEGTGYTLEAAYDAEAPFISNILLVVAFDTVVKVD